MYNYSTALYVCMHIYVCIFSDNMYLSYTLVPKPLVIMKILNNQTVGQSLRLKCSVMTVRGITSKVDMLWLSNGSEIKRIEEVNFSSVTNNSKLVQFTDYYVISQLTTADEDISYQCEVLIDANKAVESISLNVTG